MRAGLPLNVEGGKVQFRAASSAAERRRIGPSELVTQIFPFSSTIANTLTVPDHVVALCGGRVAGRYSFCFPAIQEPALTSCGSAAAEALVGRNLLPVRCRRGLAVGVGGKRIRNSVCDCTSAGERPSEAT